MSNRKPKMPLLDLLTLQIERLKSAQDTFAKLQANYEQVSEGWRAYQNSIEQTQEQIDERNAFLEVLAGIRFDIEQCKKEHERSGEHSFPIQWRVFVCRTWEMMFYFKHQYSRFVTEFFPWKTDEHASRKETGEMIQEILDAIDAEHEDGFPPAFDKAIEPTNN